MTTRLETALASRPPSEWQLEQAVVLGWYDGPTSGVCKLKEPACSFLFDLLGARFDLHTDDRLYRLAELPITAVDRLLSALSGEAGGPSSPIWVPRWRFDREEDERAASAAVAEVRSSAVQTPIIIRARDVDQYLGFWLDVSEEFSLGSSEDEGRSTH